jgi:hypothetical protein
MLQYCTYGSLRAPPTTYSGQIILSSESFGKRSRRPTGEHLRIYSTGTIYSTYLVTLYSTDFIPLLYYIAQNSNIITCRHGSGSNKLNDAALAPQTLMGTTLLTVSVLYLSSNNALMTLRLQYQGTCMHNYR